MISDMFFGIDVTEVFAEPLLGCVYGDSIDGDCLSPCVKRCTVTDKQLHGFRHLSATKPDVCASCCEQTLINVMVEHDTTKLFVFTGKGTGNRFHDRVADRVRVADALSLYNLYPLGRD